MERNNILFLLNRKKDNSLLISKEIVLFLASKNLDIFVEEDLVDELPNVSLYAGQKIDFSIVVGGDGTILNYAHKYKDLNLSFFGINLGRVGALADSSVDNYKEKIEDILNGKHYIEERNVMNCKIYEDDKLLHEVPAFNEVSINRAELYKMLLINMTINDHNKTSFYADGVIVATATGSSAYSLSCGGPLLLPDAKNFVIAPISPQLRVITSLVVNDTDKITIDLKDSAKREDYSEHSPIVFIDGAYSFKFTDKSKLVVTKSDRILKIIKTNKEASLFEPIFKVSLSTSDLFTTKKD